MSRFFRVLEDVGQWEWGGGGAGSSCSAAAAAGWHGRHACYSAGQSPPPPTLRRLVDPNCLGGTMSLFFVYFWNFTVHTVPYIHSIIFIQYIHSSPFAEVRYGTVPLHFLIAGQLSGKNLSRVPSRESNSGLPYSKPTHYVGTYWVSAAPYPNCLQCVSGSSFLSQFGPDPRSHTNAHPDLDPGQLLKPQKVEFLHEKYILNR